LGRLNDYCANPQTPNNGGFENRILLHAPPLLGAGGRFGFLLN
jgi:hypothetical protein